MNLIINFKKYLVVGLLSLFSISAQAEAFNAQLTLDCNDTVSILNLLDKYENYKIGYSTTNSKDGTLLVDTTYVFKNSKGVPTLLVLREHLKSKTTCVVVETELNREKL